MRLNRALDAWPHRFGSLFNRQRGGSSRATRAMSRDSHAARQTCAWSKTKLARSIAIQARGQTQPLTSDSAQARLQATALTPWHQLHIDEVAQLLKTDLAKGLSLSEAESRAREYGLNKLSEAPPQHWWSRLLSQFNQLVLWILIAATLLSAILGDWLEAGAILAIVLLNALLGFFQEQKAEKALSSLKKLSSPVSKVMRDGSLRIVAAAELVPGDVVEVEAGDQVPADARLVNNVRIENAGSCSHW